MASAATARVAPCFVTPRTFTGLWLTTSTRGPSCVVPVAPVAWHGHDVLNPHPAGEQSHRQEEADDQYGDQHDYPRQRLQAAETQSLEHAGTEDTHNNPPEHRAVRTHRGMVDHARYGYQKNGR